MGGKYGKTYKTCKHNSLDKCHIFALFVFLLFASINCKDFKEAQKQGEKYIFFFSIVAILLDIIWIIIGLFADVSINGPIVLIVFWIFMII